MKNEDLCDLIFRKNFTFGRRTSKFAKENPKIAPPQEKKRKKNPKHLKCSLTRAKTKAIRVDSSSLSFFLSLSLSTPLDDHDIGVEP